MSEPTVAFSCDAMHGGLARWLRAAGYDASWSEGIADWDLIRLARTEGRLLLTSDTGIFRIGLVRDGEAPAVLVPHGLGKREQLAFVLRELHLPLRAIRCMACGGPLVEAPRESVRERVPPRTFAWREHFSECARCGRLFWEGTHWQQIAAFLREAAGAREGPSPQA